MYSVGHKLKGNPVTMACLYLMMYVTPAGKTRMSAGDLNGWGPEDPLLGWLLHYPPGDLAGMALRMVY